MSVSTALAPPRTCDEAMHGRTQTRAMPRPRVLLGNSHLLVAEILDLALNDQFEVVGAVPRLDLVLESVQRTRPDVVVLDIQSEGGVGIALIEELRRTVPGTAVLVLTAQADAETVTAVMAAGASGYLTLDADMREVADAVRGSAEGKVVLSGRRLEALVRHLSRQALPPAPAQGMRLTDRELAVLRMLVEGATTSRISSELGISTSTTRTHIQHVLTKLGVHSRLKAAAYAAANGLA